MSIVYKRTLRGDDEFINKQTNLNKHERLLLLHINGLKTLSFIRERIGLDEQKATLYAKNLQALGLIYEVRHKIDTSERDEFVNSLQKKVTLKDENSIDVDDLNSLKEKRILKYNKYYLIEKLIENGISDSDLLLKIEKVTSTIEFEQLVQNNKILSQDKDKYMNFLISNTIDNSFT